MHVLIIDFSFEDPTRITRGLEEAPSRARPQIDERTGWGQEVPSPREREQKMIHSNVDISARDYRKVLAVGFLLAALMAAVMMLTAKPAHAGQTFTVSNTGDPAEGAPEFGICNNTFCTMRAAIIAANATPGEDTIEFNLARPDLRFITPTRELPVITEAVTIDGYTQLFARPNTKPVGNDASVLVQLVGLQAGSAADGLIIEANGVTVRGLAIRDFDSGSGIKIEGSNNRVDGNFIGTDSLGRREGQGNEDGVFILDGQNNTVGGNTPAARNLISGNDRDGVRLFGTSLGTDDNRVQNNYIGTDKFGTGSLGNGGAGVTIFDSSRNAVGGGNAEANIIAFNALDGVAVRSGNNIFADSGNSIRSNSIFSNGGLGIDLIGGTENAAGATANDPGDVDTGPNDLQNKPALTSAVSSGGNTTVKGKLDSTPNKTFLVEFFSNAAGNEGRKLLGQKTVTTNASGVATYTFTVAQAVPAGQGITATATDQGRNTSEFSAPRAVVAG